MPLLLCGVVSVSRAMEREEEALQQMCARRQREWTVGKQRKLMKTSKVVRVSLAKRGSKRITTTTTATATGSACSHTHAHTSASQPIPQRK